MTLVPNAEVNADAQDAVTNLQEEIGTLAISHSRSSVDSMMSTASTSSGSRPALDSPLFCTTPTFRRFRTDPNWDLANSFQTINTPRAGSKGSQKEKQKTAKPDLSVLSRV